MTKTGTKTPTFRLRGYATTAASDPTYWSLKTFGPVQQRGSAMEVGEKMVDEETNGREVALARVGSAARRSRAPETGLHVNTGQGITAGGSGWRHGEHARPRPRGTLAAVCGGGRGIVQIEQNANTLAAAANDILQDNTVGPQQMITGNIALRNCCDMYAPDGSVIKFEVKAGDTTKVFLFKRIKLQH